MIPVLSRDQMRAFDKCAVEECNVPGVVLMENAGRGAADVLSAIISEKPCGPTANTYERFPKRHRPAPGQPASYPLRANVVVVCGSGNNGGDGYVVARHLMARGAEVRVFLAGNSEKVTGDARINHDAYIDLGGVLTELPAGSELTEFEGCLSGADYVIDALFGTGLDRPVQGFLVDIIEAINRSSARCLALDIPSGLDADSGYPLGAAILADHTVTFGHLKVGLLTPDGARLAGDVHVVDLGVPDATILERVGHIAEVIDPHEVASKFAEREANTHKHAAGNVLVVAGSPGKVGAALLTARAVLRAGAGLSTILSWPAAIDSIQGRAAEIMTSELDADALEASLQQALEGRSAVAIGPGLGLDAQAKRIVDHVLFEWDGPKVVDADAITLFQDRVEDLSRAKGRVVLTPHPGELGRLLGKSSTDIESDRFGAVRDAVERTGCTVILKGARTLIATPSGELFICMAGNPVLSTAGAGDVLTGILAALCCAMPVVEAARMGVLLHAQAADRWRERTGSDRGLLAGEIANELPALFATFLAGDGS